MLGTARLRLGLDAQVQIAVHFRGRDACELGELRAHRVQLRLARRAPQEERARVMKSPGSPRPQAMPAGRIGRLVGTDVSWPDALPGCPVDDPPRGSGDLSLIWYRRSGEVLEFSGLSDRDTGLGRDVPTGRKRTLAAPAGRLLAGPDRGHAGGPPRGSHATARPPPDRLAGSRKGGTCIPAVRRSREP